MRTNIIIFIGIIAAVLQPILGDACVCERSKTVCGTDGKDYNECQLFCEASIIQLDVKIAHDGECKNSSIPSNKTDVTMLNSM